MVEEGGDGEGADAAGFWGESEVLAEAGGGAEVACQVAVFAGGAGVDDGGADAKHGRSNETGYASRCHDYIKLGEFCQVVAFFEDGNRVAGVLPHAG